MTRIALVTPWFGRELIGGAERHAWELAHALAAAGANVDVLATCCRSFNDDWSTNFYRAGVSTLADRLQLLRFRVDSRDRVAFGRVTAALTALPEISLRGDVVPLGERDARTFVTENINSRALTAHLCDAGAGYDAVLFMPYLYGTTLAALPQVAQRAFLIPCLHDEAYAYLAPVRACIAEARGILFNSRGEEETAAAIFGPALLAKSHVVGEAVEAIVAPRSQLRLRGGFSPQRSRYILYLGRQVPTKNVDFLVAAYRRFREQREATSLQLVLAGPTTTSRSGDGVVDVGPVNDDAKAALLTHARALAQPSLHESFSRAMYEAWSVRRPAIVHAGCLATARAVEESGGGWVASTLDDWAQRLATVDEAADEWVDAAGRRGYAAAHENGTWNAVARRVLAALAPQRARYARMDQVVPLGNRAVTAYAAALAQALQSRGEDVATTIAGAHAEREGSLVIAHVADDVMPVDAAAIVVHGGQPPARSAPLFAASLEVGVSLGAAGIAARVLPFSVSPATWAGVQPAHRRWLDVQPVMLSLAPLVAADARRLLDVFVALLALERRARLLVFESDCDGEARHILTTERAELDLADEVELVGPALPERYAAYRAARVALALGRPLHIASAVMPAWFDLPVVALGDVLPEAAHAASLTIDGDEARRVAALVRLVAQDDALRSALQTEARRLRERHLPRTVVMQFDEHVISSLPSTVVR